LDKILRPSNINISESNILGDWRGREIHTRGEDLGYLTIYHYFDCIIQNKPEGLWFEKSSGSHTSGGRLYKRDSSSYVFVSSHENGGAPRGHAWVGLLTQTSPNRLKILFPVTDLTQNKDFRFFDAVYDILDVVRNR
jgi:hypothetical protein